MESNFSYDAPQFVDFTRLETDFEDTAQIESYFDYDHEMMEAVLLQQPPAPISSEENGTHMEELIIIEDTTLDVGDVLPDQSSHLNHTSEKLSNLNLCDKIETTKNNSEANEILRTKSNNSGQNHLLILAQPKQQPGVRKYTSVSKVDKYQTLTNSRSTPKNKCLKLQANGDPLEIDMLEKFYTPMTKTEETTTEQPTLRRSLSVGNILPGKSNVGHMSKKQSYFNVSEAHAGTRNGSFVNRRLTKRSSSSSSIQNRLLELAQPKQQPKVQNFVSQAEFVKRFQQSTPARFRTAPKGSVAQLPVNWGPLKPTYPKSPALVSKTRHRDTTVISHQERELLEFEEAQKQKIKAQPLNKRIFGSPARPHVDKKPNTVVKPFNLTQPTQIKEIPPPPVKDAGARPKIKDSLQRTIPQTPLFVRKYMLKMKENAPPVQDEIEKPKTEATKLTRTVMKPFSFEKTTAIYKKRKEARLVQEEAEIKKRAEFHAKPMPKNLLKSPKIKPKIQKRSNSMESLDSYKSGEGSQASCNEGCHRPKPSHKVKPFVPILPERPPIVIQEFQLQTQRRAKERSEFDEKVKEIREKREHDKLEAETEKLKREQEEYETSRKLAIRKAKPMPVYNSPMFVTNPKPLTNPITPKFVRRIVLKENTDNIAEQQ